MILKNPNGRVVRVDKTTFNIYKDKQGWTVVDEEAPEGASYPIAKGAGWYELSDGSSVRGEDNAKAKQAELNG